MTASEKMVEIFAVYIKYYDDRDKTEIIYFRKFHHAETFFNDLKFCVDVKVIDVITEMTGEVKLHFDRQVEEDDIV